MDQQLVDINSYQRSYKIVKEKSRNDQTCIVIGLKWFQKSLSFLNKYTDNDIFLICLS